MTVPESRPAPSAPASALRLLAIDPGGMTGLATFSPDRPEPWLSYELTPGETATFVRTWLTAHAGLTPLGPRHDADAHVVMERFTPSARALSFQPDALELIGYVRHTCAEFGVPFTLQAPATAKNVCHNDLLRRLGAWRKGTAGHGMDATRHAVLWLHTHRPHILRALKAAAPRSDA